jgi:hypothetical protein
MQILESAEGQQAYEFKDILKRRMSGNGENMLQLLSSENYIKRVPQNAVIVKPNSKSSIRLDELVRLLAEAGKGDEAVKKLDEMDRQLGMNDDPKQTNAARNNAKSNAVNTADGPDTIHYGDEAPAAPAPADATQMMMMEMMKTMQAMQKEIASMKKSTAADKKAAKAKTAV